MQKYVSFVAVLVMAGLVFDVPMNAQKGGSGKLTETPIQTTFRDDPADAIWSDGLPYETDSATKSQNVLTATGAANYILETFTATRGTPLRCVSIDLSRVVAQVPGEIMPASGCLDVGFSTLSFFFDSKDSLRDMTAGQMVPKRLAIGWVSGGTEYHLRFKGETVNLGDGSGNHELANVGFTCTASASGCLAWTAEPIRCKAAQAPGAYNSFTDCVGNNLAVLERRSTTGSSTPVMIAVVQMPFSMDIIRN